MSWRVLCSIERTGMFLLGGWSANSGIMYYLNVTLWLGDEQDVIPYASLKSVHVEDAAGSTVCMGLECTMYVISSFVAS